MGSSGEELARLSQRWATADTRHGQRIDVLSNHVDEAAVRRARQPKPHKPWPSQREAVSEVLNAFDAANRTLILVPSLSLFAQTLREWTANTVVGFDFLPVCSDETVAERDAFVATTSDLGFSVTTNPQDIAAFLRRRSGPQRLRRHGRQRTSVYAPPSTNERASHRCHK